MDQPTPRTIAVASANPHKLEEIRAILAPLGFEPVGLEAWPDIDDLPETADTFEGNALMKARALAELKGVVAVADDSGLEVDALSGAPGVHSKRFTPEASHAANNTKLLSVLDGQRDRTARFRCVIALVTPDGREALASGSCEGSIGQGLRGRGGFGYDPLFLPDEAPGRSMAELSADEKNAISHRGRAFRQLPGLLERLGL
jgi:XTP/dITP diphosphohydrolase